MASCQDRHFHRLLAGFLAVILFELVPPSSAAAAERGWHKAGQARILPPGSRPHGKSYSQWIADWWQWVAETPTDDHPLLDPTGADCAEGQRGHVWFLGGSFTSGTTVNRACTVPPGTALFFPIAPEAWLSTPATEGCTALDPWYLATPADRARWALFEQAILKNPDTIWPPNPRDVLSLEIDGRRVGNLRRLYARSHVFAARLPEDNIFDVLCGVEVPSILTSPDVGWGYYAFLTPLPRGTHTLRWTADVVGGQPPYTFGPIRQNVTYTLTVEPRRHRPAKGS